MGFVSSHENVELNSSVLFDRKLNYDQPMQEGASKFRKFCMEFGKKKYEEELDKIANNERENKDFQTFDEIKQFCNSLPKEWTVLQISKDHDKHTTSYTKDHILQSAQPIYISLLNHARSSEYPDPICFKLDGPSVKMAGEFV